MTNADYLGDRRYVRANRYPARRARNGGLRACDRGQRRPARTAFELFPNCCLHPGRAA